jgi:DNA-binding protein H-NS
MHMSNLDTLLAQKAELERQIDAARKQGRSDAVAKVRTLMAEHGLTLADLSGKTAPRPAKTGGGKVAAKYRNTATGETWSGRGLQPKWLKAALATGRKIEEFSV